MVKCVFCRFFAFCYLFMKKYCIWMLGATSLFLACTVDKTRLEGHWRAVAFYENGQQVNTPLDSVSLYFTPNGTYVFRAAGHYKEAGFYKTTLYYVVLQDTTITSAPKDRTIGVQYLSKDTLKLEMGRDGKMQVLFMAR